MEEIWKDIENYEGLYQISNLGNVKSLEKELKIKSKNQYKQFDMKLLFKGKMLKPSLKSSGYYYVCLTRDKKTKYYAIHRLVAQTFLDNPNNYNYINHKDENKLNNCVDNLEWCSAKYNCNYGDRTNKIIQKLNVKILQYDLNGNFIKEWASIKDATETLKIRNISQVVNNKRNKAGGFIWKKSKA